MLEKELMMKAFVAEYEMVMMKLEEVMVTIVEQTLVMVE
jgi:hypothetical protein